MPDAILNMRIEAWHVLGAIPYMQMTTKHLLGGFWGMEVGGKP